MKRQKTLTIMAVIVFVLCAIGLFAIAGCKTDESGEHEHTFMRVWSSDAEGHWHKATCEHTEEKGDYAPHVDVEQPYDVCDVCGYKMEHKHRYEENWSYDAENHWHNSTCNDVADDGREAHAWGRAVFVEPTCEEDGYNLYTCSVCGATKTEPTPNSPALGHAIGAEIVPDVPATCSEEGVKAHYECSVCHEIFKKTDDVDDNGNPVYEKMTHEEYAIEIDEDAHEWDNGRETTPATCTTVGVMTYTCINNPDHTKTGEIPMTPHEWNADGECIHCGADRPYRILPDEEQTNSNFTLLEMGRYPQSQEKDAEKLAELNEKYPETPTDSNANGWTAEKPNQYVFIDATAKFWYKDVDLDGDGTYDYRGVYFNKYQSVYSSGEGVSQQPFGYLTNTVYWFKWEPIIWRKLQKQVFNDPELDALNSDTLEDPTKAIILSDKILDGKYFDIETKNGSNKYENSDIRKFLNGTFYNTAFSRNVKNSILETQLDDYFIDKWKAEVAGTDYIESGNIVSDKIFLLSRDEILYKYKIAFPDIKIQETPRELEAGGRWDGPDRIVEKYPLGYNNTKGSSCTEEDYFRQLYMLTDYAKARGVMEYKNEFVNDNCFRDRIYTYVTGGGYWTRQCMISSLYPNEVYKGGGHGGSSVTPYSMCGGVLPAMWITL